MYRRMLIVAFTGIILLLSCSKKEKVQAPLLVSVNGHGIAKDRFKTDFLITKEYRQAKEIDSLLIVEQLKKYYLDNLYLIAEAYERGIQNDPEYKRQVHEEKVVQLTHIDGLLYDKIMPASFGISSSELKDLYEKVKIGYKVAFIKVSTKELADSLYQLAKNGADFGTLADKYSIDLRSAMYEGMIPWYFTFGTFARPFEKAVMQLKPGEISQPVKTNTGYHVIKLLDKKQNPLDSYDKAEYELQKRLKQIKRTDFIQDYIGKLFKRYNFKVDAATAKALLPLLQGRKENGTIHENDSMHSLWSKTIVHFTDGTLNVGDIIYKYNLLPRFERIPIKRYGDLELILKTLSVQELMYRDALNMKLDQDPLINQKISRFAYNRLQEFARRKLIEDPVTVSDAEAKEYFKKNHNLWKNDTFKRVDKFVRFRVRSEKEAVQKNKLMSKLKEQWHPVFNTAIIRQTAAELNIHKHGTQPKTTVMDTLKKK